MYFIIYPRVLSGQVFITASELLDLSKVFKHCDHRDSLHKRSIENVAVIHSVFVRCCINEDIRLVFSSSLIFMVQTPLCDACVNFEWILSVRASNVSYRLDPKISDDLGNLEMHDKLALLLIAANRASLDVLTVDVDAVNRQQ